MTKYEKIYQDILSKIDSETILANTYLPSENELMKIYSVSRDTIRKVLNTLMQNGYIQKNKGKGSLVLDRSQVIFPISGVTSFKEISKMIDADVTTKIHIFEKCMPTIEVKKALNIKNQEIYHIERIRNFNNERVILDVDYINSALIGELKESDICESLYDYIENTLGLKIAFARKEITVAKATEEEMNLLDMLEYDLLVYVKSYTYLEDATLLQYTISKHRPDKFRFVDFARRTKF